MALFRTLQSSPATAAAGIAAVITGVLGTSCLFNDYSRDDHEHDQKKRNHAVSGVSLAASTRCESNRNKPNVVSIPSSSPGTKLLFLGSGSSTGCPKPICSLVFPSKNEDLSSSASSSSPEQDKLMQLQKNLAKICNTSKIASIGDPKTNKNYRNNPSLLISHRNNDDKDVDDDTTTTPDNQNKSAVRNVIIDVGKTFREGAIRWMPHHGIYSIDGIVLTHEHADAILGLDDLRGFQISPYMISAHGNRRAAGSDALPVFLSEVCMETVKRQFGYLVPKERSKVKEDIEMKKKKDGVKVVRAVASLDFRIIEHFQPFVVAGLKMIPLPVLHGEDLICNGYAFTVRGDGKTGDDCISERGSQNGNGGGKSKLDPSRNVTNVVYLSDISRMIPETEQFILEHLPPTDILIVDSLLQTRPHSVHFNLNQAIELIQRLKPKKTYIVGMNCDDFPEHDEANAMIRERNPTIHVELAHDGLAIEL